MIIYLTLIKKIRDNFRKDTSSKKKKDDYDYLFNRKDNNVKEDKFDNLLKKKNDDDFSNIDSEINKILGKDNNGFNFNNNNNNIYSSNRYKSQKLNNPYNNNDLFSLPKEKQYDKNNLKPIINGGRRGGGGGGLMAIGYEPNKNSLFNDFDFGGLGINRKQDNINNKYGYKKDTQPVVIKEKKNNNIFGFNNREDQPGYKNNMNNNFGKNDKFSAYERNNPLMNQFNNEMNGVSRRKRNFYSSPNYLGWGI